MRATILDSANIVALCTAVGPDIVTIDAAHDGLWIHGIGDGWWWRAPVEGVVHEPGDVRLAADRVRYLVDKGELTVTRTGAIFERLGCRGELRIATGYRFADPWPQFFAAPHSWLKLPHDFSARCKQALWASQGVVHLEAGHAYATDARVACRVDLSTAKHAPITLSIPTLRLLERGVTEMARYGTLLAFRGPKLGLVLAQEVRPQYPYAELFTDLGERVGRAPVRSWLDALRRFRAIEGRDGVVATLEATNQVTFRATTMEGAMSAVGGWTGRYRGPLGSYCVKRLIAGLEACPDEEVTVALRAERAIVLSGKGWVGQITCTQPPKT